MKAINGIVDRSGETFSDDPGRKGHRFEKYVENLFDPTNFTLVEKRVNQLRYVENSMNFDFIWRYNPTRQDFAVDAKYHSHLNKDLMLPVCRPDQLWRYKDFVNKRGIPYFIVIGLAGKDDDPGRMFSIPLKGIKFPNLYPSVFKDFERNPKSGFHWKNGILT